MAIVGVHIAFTAVTTPAIAGALLPDTSLTLSQLMASAGTSTISAPPNGQLLRVSASAPIFYAVGQTPDASAGSSTRRYYDPATGPDDSFCHIGDRVAWVLA